MNDILDITSNLVTITLFTTFTYLISKTQIQKKKK